MKALVIAIAMGAMACGEGGATLRERAAAKQAAADARFGKQGEDDVRAANGMFRDALALWMWTGDVGKQAEVAGAVGDTFDNLGDMVNARAWSALALELYRRAGDTAGEAQALSWVGIADVHLDRARAAITEFEQARDLAAAHHDDAGFAYAMLNLGYAHNDQEEWRESEAAIQVALPIFERLGDRVSVATCHNNLGTQYARLGDIDGALAQHGAALAIRLADGMKLDRGWSLCNLGGVELDLRGDANAALEKFTAARAVWTEVGNQVGLPLAIASMARATAALGRAEEARALFDQALAGYEAVASKHGAAQVVVERAEVTRERAGFEDGLARATAAELPSYQARALLGLAQLDAATEPAQAAAELDRGIALIEGMRAKVVREEQRRGLFALVQGSYELRIALALAAHDDATAFATLERARARTLIEALAAAGGQDRAAAATIDAVGARALLADGTVLVSYQLAEPTSHAFVLTADALRVVDLPGRGTIETTARTLIASTNHAPGAAAQAQASPQPQTVAVTATVAATVAAARKRGG